MILTRFFLALFCLLLAVPALRAHPVPPENHDRIIVVHLQKANNPNQVRVRVAYRLEVDADTIILDDMRPFRDEIDINKIKTRRDYFAEYARLYEPLLAGNLLATVNGGKLATFTGLPKERRIALEDDKGEPLGHVCCDFVFEALVDVLADQDNALRFVDKTWYLQKGKIDLTLVNEAGLDVVRLKAPDQALKDKQGKFGLDDDALRTVEIAWRPRGLTPPAQKTVGPETLPYPTPEQHLAAPPGHDSLLNVYDSGINFWLLLLVFVGLGALHALTPGHGKTLVAAYLVGERGTVFHALMLGIVTTLTHTGAVLLLAGALLLLPSATSQEMQSWLQHGLGLLMGLMIVALGFFLLLQRLAGRSDHFHVGGGHHHHHHHHQPTTSPAVENGSSSDVRWWALLLLGIQGGIIPCWDAIAILIYAIAKGEFLLALPMLLAFSAGLAAVLVLVGVMVVKLRGFATSRFGEGTWTRRLPLISAVVVLVMGLWLCYQSVNQ